jgi:hypothetical protein
MNQNNILYNDLTQESPKIIQDQRIKIKLKEHQKTAIDAMINFENTGIVAFTKKAYVKNYQIFDEDTHNRYYYYWRNHDNELNNKYKNMRFEIETNYGILADKVGSGKTFITMGLISYNQVPKERDRIISSSVYTVTRYKDIEVPKKTNLIIVPHNLISQWKIAFGYCTLKTFTVAKRCDIETLVFEDNIFKDHPPTKDADYTEINCIEYYDCIIVSSTMFDNFYTKFETIKWARIIIDEVVSIKLPSDLEFKCNFIWFLTATPSGIKYVRRNYIRSLVTGMSDYTINNIIIKNNDTYVDNSMNLPNINQILIKCLTPKELNIIKDYVDGDIINMLNAGNTQDAIAKLNCNIETTDNILEVVTKKIKKELHNKKKELEYEQQKIPDDKKAHDEKIKRIEEKIKELEGKCQGIEQRITSFKEENCPICFMEFDDSQIPMLTPCCNNIFCLQCLTLCKSCPMCRVCLDITKCICINDKKEDDSNDKIDDKKVVEKTLCSKVDNLITIINKKSDGKFLVFSNYDKTFENINQKLTDAGIKHNRLIGSNIVINSTLRKFESGEIKVLMLNAINYGSGLNLQMASDIIIYHELDVELETQVIGRAQRLGRTEPLNVYYLLNDNEKVNCKNPTLSLDIFSTDTTMLEKFIKGIRDENEHIDLGIEDNSDDIYDINNPANPNNIANLGKSAKAKITKKINKKAIVNINDIVNANANTDTGVVNDTINSVNKVKKNKTITKKVQDKVQDIFIENKQNNLTEDNLTEYDLNDPLLIAEQEALLNKFNKVIEITKDVTDVTNDNSVTITDIVTNIVIDKAITDNVADLIIKKKAKVTNKSADKAATNKAATNKASTNDKAVVDKKVVKKDVVKKEKK